MYSPENDGTEAITIQVVDDEEHNRKVIRKHLSKVDNIEIIESAEWKDAMEKAQKNQPDLILLDIMMPEQDGFETCRQLKQMESTSDIPVIFLSALDDVESKKTGFQAGGVDYVSKPFQAEELISRVSTHVTLQKQKHKLRTYSRELEDLVQERTQELQDKYEALNNSESLYRAIFETTHNPTLIIEPDNTIGLCNNAFASLVQRTKTEIEGKRKWYEYVHPDYKQKMQYYRDMRYQDPANTPKSYEVRFLTPDNENRVMWISADIISGTDRIVASLLDMTEQRNYEAELEKQMFYDPLTLLANRTLLLNRIKKSIDRQKQDPDFMFAIIFLDIDRFQMINESLGHLAGDQLLQKVAELLNEMLGYRNTVARFAGDKFVILLEEVGDYFEVAKLAEQIRTKVNQEIWIDDHSIYISSSLGIVMGSNNYQEPNNIVGDAETAVQQAKSEGRNAIKAFNPTMHQKVFQLFQMEKDLRQALENREFLLFYQPILDLSTERIIGVESLIRWKHPDKGMVSPGDFIPLAEDTDLIIPIGKMVLQDACKQLKEWQERLSMPDLMASINLSPLQIQQKDLAEILLQELNSNGLDPQNLKLEITESVIMQDLEKSVQILNTFREIGVTVAIDDFGTGYSSLSYLQKFPIDNIKIDRSFIWSMQKADNNYILVKAIANMASNLNLQIIAEGIETREQLEILQGLECEYGQGFHFSKPLPPEEMERLLLKEQGQ